MSMDRVGRSEALLLLVEMGWAALYALGLGGWACRGACCGDGKERVAPGKNVIKMSVRFALNAYSVKCIWMELVGIRILEL